MTLAELSLKRPVTVIMLFVSMTVIGLIAAFRLPLESFPDIQFPFLEIVLPYKGSTPAASGLSRRIFFTSVTALPRSP